MSDSTPTPTRIIEVIPETDSRFIILRIDRMLLVALILVLAFSAAVYTFGIMTSIRSDDRQVQETRELRKELDQANEIINNANDISRANTDFLRCAFLIEPDVQKTPDVIDACIKQARFPEKGR